MIKYVNYFNLPSANFRRIYVDHSCASACPEGNIFVPCQFNNSAPRQPLKYYNQLGVAQDICLTLTVVPSAEILVYIGATVGEGFTTISKVAANNYAPVVLINWVTPQNLIPAPLLPYFEFLFLQMVLQGQSVFSPTGDSGPFADYPNRQFIVNEPAGERYVVAVGGTSLTVNLVTIK